MLLRAGRGAADRSELETLFEEIEQIDGYAPLTEDALIAIDAGRAGPGLVAIEDGAIVGHAHIRPLGCHGVVETAVHPAHRPVLARRLLEAAISEAGRGRLLVWVSDAETLAAVGDLGFESRRHLLHLVRSLPPTEPARLPGTIDVMPFRPERDIGALLEVNNAAFAGHPENGSWTVETIEGRMRRRWFDPGGLFLAWEQGRPVGVCWTKLHPRSVGEIYLIAVHPDAQGRSLGTGLALTGLWHLSDRRGAVAAILYTDADNAPARRLYERLGFGVLRAKQCLERKALSVI